MLHIEVLNIGYFGEKFDSELIGSYEFDLPNIYFSYQHRLQDIWVMLVDTTDEREGA